MVVPRRVLHERGAAELDGIMPGTLSVPGQFGAPGAAAHAVGV
ncbi:hypothetical protein ACFZAU_03955 [Streptomyces sp. NPDC008238]